MNSGLILSPVEVLVEHGLDFGYCVAYGCRVPFFPKPAHGLLLRCRRNVTDRLQLQEEARLSTAPHNPDVQVRVTAVHPSCIGNPPRPSSNVSSIHGRLVEKAALVENVDT